MAKKEFLYHGKNIEELKALSLQEFSQLTPARLRRTIKRGFTEEQKIFLNKLKRSKRSFKTHCRDMVILPEMVGKTIDIHNGNKFVSILIEIEMLGHVLGELTLTRKRITHSSPGIGATRSSSALSVR